MYNKTITKHFFFYVIINLTYKLRSKIPFFVMLSFTKRKHETILTEDCFSQLIV